MTILSIGHFRWPIDGEQFCFLSHAVVLGTLRGQVLARHPRDRCLHFRINHLLYNLENILPNVCTHPLGGLSRLAGAAFKKP